jgi:hypothetical protein
LDGVGTASGRAEELAAHLLAERSPKRRVLVIVNPYATTVSDRLRSLVLTRYGPGTRRR